MGPGLKVKKKKPAGFTTILNSLKYIKIAFSKYTKPTTNNKKKIKLLIVIFCSDYVHLFFSPVYSSTVLIL